MADWQAIKTEYITTKTSYRKLADKYGVHKDTIGQKAKAEKWGELRRQHIDSTQTKILEADSKRKVSRAEKIQSVADKLLSKVEALVEASDPLEMDTQAMKHISGVLKDIKEIQMIKSDADMREQEARIRNLQKQAQSDDNKREPIRVIIDDGLNEYSK